MPRCCIGKYRVCCRLPSLDYFLRSFIFLPFFFLFSNELSRTIRGIDRYTMSNLEQNDEKTRVTSSDNRAGETSNETYEEDNGAIRVGTNAALTNLKTTKDGKTILIPQPSDDPADPLNWSWVKKHLVLLSLFMPALLTDFGMTWGRNCSQS